MRKPRPELLQTLLQYDPETGALHWRKRSLEMFANCPLRPAHEVRDRWNTKNAGRAALTAPTHNGYMFGTLLGKSVRAHHVIWAMMTGKWPTAQIDHINGVRTDNRWCNLRQVQQLDNSRNMGLPSDNTSGRVGVSRARRGRWQAYINRDRKRINLGEFGTFEEAVAAREAAELDCGYHPNDRRWLAPSNLQPRNP
jgi:hypothetical protein